jgi:hypothetical protein
MMRSTAALLFALVLAGCASTPAPSTTTPTPVQTRENDHSFRGALAAPFHDVNVVRTKIPDTLLDAIDAPYARPRPMTCPEIAAEVAPLDDALGPDLDKPATADNPSLLQRGGTLGHNTAADAMRSTVEGLIPYRAWVRKLSGAEQHDRLVEAAIAAGAVRRAYLKGLGLSMRCPGAAEPTSQAQAAVAGFQRLQRAADAAAAAR